MNKVTISIPIYNVSKYVKESILSALNQTYKNIEFLIIDDKSTDNSMDIVYKIVSNHPRKNNITIINQIKNKGLGDARNISIEKATGDFIYFMDSDDIIMPDCIERLVNYMIENPVDFIASSRCRKTFEGKFIANDIYKPSTISDNTNLSVARFRYINNNKILGEVWNKLYNLEFLKRNNIKCIPGVHVEDVSFSLQVNIAARSCRLVPDITYIYHIHEGQSFSAFSNNRDRSKYLVDCFFKIKEYDLSLLNKYKNTFEYGGLVANILNVSLVHTKMVYTSKVFSYNEKIEIINKLLSYPLNISELIKLKSKIINNLFFWTIHKSPLFIKKFFLKKMFN